MTIFERDMLLYLAGSEKDRVHVHNFDDERYTRLKTVVLYSDYNYFLRELVHLSIIDLSRYSLQQSHNNIRYTQINWLLS